jgi:hypothetical protein
MGTEAGVPVSFPGPKDTAFVSHVPRSLRTPSRLFPGAAQLRHGPKPLVLCPAFHSVPLGPWFGLL